VEAAKELATLYRTGSGTTKDFQEAARWLCFAADAGDTAAMTDLATLLLSNDFGPQDVLGATALLNLASLSGSSEARAILARTRPHLSADDTRRLSTLLSRLKGNGAISASFDPTSLRFRPI
jgi:TPR repeat protein